MDPARDHRALERLQRRLERWLARPDAALFAPPPGAAAWSPGQHVYHVALANELSLENVLSLVHERGLLRTEPRPLERAAEEILARGRLPRGTRAPRFVSPPPRLARAALADVVGASRDAIARVGAVLGRVRGAPLAIPHQALGTLDAPRWLRFARAHAAHHLRILGGGSARAGRGARD